MAMLSLHVHSVRRMEWG